MVQGINFHTEPEDHTMLDKEIKIPEAFGATSKIVGVFDAGERGPK